MTAASRLPLALVLATLLVAGGTGCATASRATTAPPPEPPVATEKAERPRAPKKPRVSRRTAPAKVAPARAPAPRKPEVVPFEPATMTRPQKLSGREPELTPEAVSRRVRGTALVRCIVTRKGEVKDCRLLNRLPHMDEELLAALSTWHVTPATRKGEPLAVDYTFVVRLPSEQARRAPPVRPR
ncbi:MAG TPA: TonB family protein [Myxococcaceae bacterium]|nr:TonB family protein [Myxococcaceae bacterium]